MTAVPLLIDAWLSDCGTYRYTLRRTLPGSAVGRLAWVMLNPSKADASKDDPTIRKVRGFTERAGYGVFYVVNLFAFRATKPAVLRAMVRDRGLFFAEGPENRDAISAVVQACDAVVCAWGAEPYAEARGHVAIGFLRTLGKPLLCLGTAKNGAPLHPLMPSYDGHPLIPFVDGPNACAGTEEKTK